MVLIISLILYVISFVAMILTIAFLNHIKDFLCFELRVFNTDRAAFAIFFILFISQYISGVIAIIEIMKNIRGM